MPNTYTQIHIHFVFAVKNRQALVHESIRVRIEKYITGIVQNFEHKLLAIYCMSDHTYSHSHVQNVIDYVLNQPEHHKKKTFKEEYLEFLRKFEIPYEEKYLFNWIEMSSTPTEPQS